MPGNLKTYLSDPLLNRLWQDIRSVGAVKSISLDITHACNLRCTGCYFFEEGMDKIAPPPTPEGEEAAFDDFIQREKERGTNFVTIVGGEPSLALGRLKKIYDHFKTSVATNGLRKIPFEGFENLPIGVAVWGDRDTDKRLRGNGKLEIFPRALKNYRDDPRAFWYYTVAPGLAHEIESVVEQCVENGNCVLFNYYCDLGGQGGDLDFRQGFHEVQKEIDRMIERYPGKILMTSYFNEIVSTGQLFDEKWGYEVCTNLSENYLPNAARLQNGKPFNPHFRAYNADFATTRRCCTGIDRDCASCFDTWEHFSWLMLNFRKHLRSQEDFATWLTSTWLFYLINRLVDFEEGVRLLPEVHGVFTQEKVC